MRLLWLTKGLGRGGAERLVVDAAHLLDRADAELHIVYLLPWKGDLAAEAREAGAKVTCLGAGPRALLWPLRLARFLRTERFDVIHTHSPLPAAVARLIDRRARFVHTEHNMWDRYRVPTRVANAITYRRNSCVVAVSAGVADSIGRRWLASGVQPQVVVHGVATERTVRDQATRGRVRNELGIGDAELLIGTVGNFTAKKDHETLLRAFVEVSSRVAGARLIMVGSGPLEAQTRQLAEQLGIADRIVFAGKRDDVPELLAALDVFTMSSKFEGLPIAMLEAMATGLPIVATAVGGVPEAVTDGREGRLVPSGEPGLLADALVEVCTDESARRRFGGAALETAERFDLRVAVDTVDAMYEVAT